MPAWNLKPLHQKIVGEFAEREPGCRLKVQAGRALFQQLESDPSNQKNPRLRVFGFGQLRFRAFKTNFREIIAQDRIGEVEPSLRGRKLHGEIFAHPNGLSALAGEE